MGAHRQLISATVPFAEMTDYATDLRSITGGQGTFSWRFSHYEEVPHELGNKILSATTGA